MTDHAQRGGDNAAAAAAAATAAAAARAAAELGSRGLDMRRMDGGLGLR